jgi:hypothetical protein
MNRDNDYYVNSIICGYGENTLELKKCSVTERMLIKMDKMQHRNGI